MKLELKHLAPYLPYDLKGYVFYTEEDFELISLSTKDGVKNESSINSWLTGYACKPILRPLSDLIKEIKIDSIKLIPAEILFSVDNNELQDFRDFGKIPEYWKDALKIKPKFYDYYQVEFLLEWHFDIFGLIEKGLAIDINSLPQSSE